MRRVPTPYRCSGCGWTAEHFCVAMCTRLEVAAWNSCCLEIRPCLCKACCSLKLALLYRLLLLLLFEMLLYRFCSCFGCMGWVGGRSGVQIDVGRGVKGRKEAPSTEKVYWAGRYNGFLDSFLMGWAAAARKYLKLHSVACAISFDFWHSDLELLCCRKPFGRAPRIQLRIRSISSVKEP